MRTFALALLLGVPPIALAPAALGSPADAATVVTSKPPVAVRVYTPSHNFRPQVITMPAGVPVRLIVHNPSGIDHNFHAPLFFNTAKINENDEGFIHDGSIEVPKYSTVAIRLIARLGHYDLSSTKALDAVSGMQGQILVQ